MMFLVPLMVLALASQLDAAISPSNCGLRRLGESRIVGGKLAKRGDWSWSVSLTQNERHFCGGVLISDQWVLTAGHCFGGAISAPRGTQVTIGVHDLKNKDSWTQTRGISYSRVHESFNLNTISNDIALIKLDSPLNLDDTYIVPACLDETASVDVSGKNAWLTGWGAQYFGGSTTQYKFEVQMNMFTQQQCKQKYSSMFNPAYQICGGESNANSGACQGDSGGPLVYKENGRWYIVGLISWGYGCGAGTVYAKVSNFIPWIQQKISSN